MDKTRTRARLFRLLISLLLVAFSATMAVACAKNDPASEDLYVGLNYAVTDATPVYGEIVNPVVFICFADEDVSSVRSGVDEDLYDAFLGETDSVYDYYRALSFGRISVRSLFPDADGACFVYKAPYSRSHYAAVKKSASASRRYNEESTLLNNALRAAERYFDFSDVSLDVNGDGSVDSVTFLVSGSYDPSDSSAWGGLLWPHSWELSKITLSGLPASINGVKVDRYSFNFLDSVNVGVVSHEIGHVLGMPDLYHYDHDTGYLQVGPWDLMHSFTETPQFVLTHLRDKYLGVVRDGQIVDLKKSGTYRLRPVTLAGEEDTLAYRIVVSDTESIWIEYRNNSVSTYDSALPGSGLIVYRVNSSVSGNETGRYRNTYFPDEVYVYRPEVFGTGTRVKENNNLNVAYISPDNEHNKSLGGSDLTGKYNDRAIFLTNGVNTGISIVPDSISAEEIIFTVDVNGYGSSEISDMYVEGSPTINYGEDLHVRVKLKVKSSQTYITADPKNYTIDYNPELIGTQIATVHYVDEDNPDGVYCTFKLVIDDPIDVDGVAIETLPDSTEIAVGSTVDLTGLSIRVRYVSGTTNVVTYSVNGVANWSIEGVDVQKSGEYYAKITYLPFDVYVYVRIRVMSELSSLRIDEKNTSTVVDRAGGLSLNVIGVNADGSERLMLATEYDLGALDRTTLYTAQTVTVQAKEKDLSVKKTIWVVNASDFSGAAWETLPKTIYRFGEALDLSEGRIKLDFGSFSTVVPAENYFYLFDGGYSPTDRGKQTPVAEIFGERLEIDVVVLPPDGTLLSPLFDDVSVATNYVLFKNATFIDRAERTFSSYLDIRFTYTDGDLTYEINGYTFETLLDRNVRVELLNTDGQVIAKYRVFIFGDGNDDGRTDENDLDAWANALFTSTSYADVYLDADGDGIYSLTDFAVLTERYGGSV
ncbi:MAG: M6 family metalloprotease domain-containing protein [Clostridia bacterium]|nr:M6 family metalloprotease domain-containing protein [Clostridia bacterium]